MTLRLLLACLVLSGTAYGQVPVGGQTQIIPYVAGQVVPLSVAPGYAVLVELAPDERIENVVVGDSGAWQVTPTKRGDRFVVKPTSGSITDLIVMTTSRRYLFLLKPDIGGGASPFVVHFDYPELAPPAAATLEVLARYRLKGDKSLYPAKMTDDGERTTITWKPGISLPAVFSIDPDGHEALVNGRMVGSDYVVEGTAPRYLLKRDKERAVAIRQNRKAQH